MQLVKEANAAGDVTTLKTSAILSSLVEAKGAFDLSVDWKLVDQYFDNPTSGEHSAKFVIEQDANNRLVIERTSGLEYKATLIKNGAVVSTYTVPAGYPVPPTTTAVLGNADILEYDTGDVYYTKDYGYSY